MPIPLLDRCLYNPFLFIMNLNNLNRTNSEHFAMQDTFEFFTLPVYILSNKWGKGTINSDSFIGRNGSSPKRYAKYIVNDLLADAYYAITKFLR